MADDIERLQKLLARSARFRRRVEKAFKRHEERAAEYVRVDALLQEVERELEKLGRPLKKRVAARKKR